MGVRLRPRSTRGRFEAPARRGGRRLRTEAVAGTAVRALPAARSSARSARIHAVRRVADQGTPGGSIRP
ncbi:hypothetical protein AB0O47_35570 [Streptomyces noursei]|uniref:hypothetical protein n=1 Tax=Streptomyces noursei TaxID=1971 RepID=UPI00045EE548|nr:hypothetical protein DC74_3036 [Streptomyces noursei]